MKRLSPKQIADLVAQNRPALAQYDPAYLQAFVRELAPLVEAYFRPQFVGFDTLPERSNPDAPLIYAGNHSGMAFPWDAILFGLGIYTRNGNSLEGRGVRPLVAPMLMASRLMHPFMVDGVWIRAGGLPATTLNFETVMQYGTSNALIYPEGVPGIAKGFNNRYRLQPMATSFVRMALKYRTDIIPVYTINAEYINPYMYRWKPLYKLVNFFGIPFLPVGPILPLLVLMPWMLYYGMPARLTFVRGEAIRPSDWIDTPVEALPLAELAALRDRVQAQMQAGLDAAVAAHGGRPFHWASLWLALRAQGRRMVFCLPFGWAVAFNEFERLWRLHPGQQQAVALRYGWGSFWQMLWRSPLTIAFFIPVLGWIPLFIRGLRRYRPAR